MIMLIAKKDITGIFGLQHRAHKVPERIPLVSIIT